MTDSAVAPWKGSAHPLAARDWRLARLLDELWRTHFADVPRPNDLAIGFAYPWKRRLGRIRMTLDGRCSEITFNGLLDRPDVPDFVPIAIITHEIVHYAQGFGSPLPRQQAHAHGGGCVSHDLAVRGLDRYEQRLDHWAQVVWPEFEPIARAERRFPTRQLVEIPYAAAYARA